MRPLLILPALLLVGATRPNFSDSPGDPSWSAQGSDSVTASSHVNEVDGARSVELSYDFDGVNGYATVRRDALITLPHNFEIRFRMRGHGGRNDIQFKLTAGDNVWWKVWHNRAPTADWQDVVINAGDLAFAWGPSADKRLRKADGIELVVARGRDGGAGAVTISNLRIVALAGEPTVSSSPADTRNLLLGSVAKKAPRGAYPRAFLGEQPYWTLAGSDGNGLAALIDEDADIEFVKGGYSISPAVIDGGTTYSWADVKHGESLAEGRLPLPTVHWSAPRFTLDTSLVADHAGRASYAAYELTNRGESERTFELRLRLRPWQVNPPSQFLSQNGGASPISAIEQSQTRLTVVQPGEDRDPPSRRPLLIEAGAHFQRVDQPRSVGTDMIGIDIIYDLALRPGATRRVVLMMPVASNVPAFDAALPETAGYWRRNLGRVLISVPASKQTFADTVATAMAHILISRDGPMLRPGTRSYDRAWIRDGAMMSEALLRMGRADVARAFADWYAKHQFPSGKVPCCVDYRGADPVPENDSQGEYIYLVSEIYRFTHDRAALQRDWPHVLAAVRYMDALRLSERKTTTSSNLSFGLMPRSISHEGYSAKAQYSLWDDFWALRGYRDAAALGQVLGKSETAAIAASRDQFAKDLHLAILASRDHWKIAFVPGATSLGDFDPTSTTIALDPGDDQAQLDAAMLEATFERYWKEFRERASGQRPWADYTPYEVRTIGAFVRLGWRERIDDLLSFFMAGRRPPGWNQWAEVVGRNPRQPRFIGDMPHAWVESDFIRSALDMFAWDRRNDSTLVLGAGLSKSWLCGRGSSIRGLSTPYGALDFSIRGDEHDLVATIGGTARPRGGFLIAWPFNSDPPSVRVNGKLQEWPSGGLALAATGEPIRIEAGGWPAATSECRFNSKDI